MIAVSLLVFALMELAPGTILDAMDLDGLTEEQRIELIRMHNLDRPMIYRYGVYMINLLQGDLGTSDHTGTDVWDEFIVRLPNTLILAFTALIIGSVLAIPLGILAARRARTVVDNTVQVFAIIGMSMPVFWLGLLLLLAFSLHLRWLPAGLFEDGLRSLILPAICSSFTMISNATRQTRSNMLEVLQADYLRTARAKGVPEKVVIRKHALGNAWIPIITSLGTSLSNQLAGSVVVEQVFTWPGIGRMAADAVRARDVTTATGVVIMTSVIYVLVQLSVDLLYATVDPRVKSKFVSSARKAKKRDVSVVAMKGVTLIPLSDEDRAKALAAEQSRAEEPELVFSEGHGYAASMATGDEKASSFATRDISDLSENLTSETISGGGIFESAIKKYKKRSQVGDIVYSLRRNKGSMAGFIILCFMLLCFIGSLFISWDQVTSMDVMNRFARPSLRHPFGTDDFGRDLFLRVIYGTRYTLAIGLGAVTMSTLFGVTSGCFAGFYGGKLDELVMRASDVLASIPGMLLGMVVVTVLGQNLPFLMLAVSVQSIPVYVRMTRAAVLTVRNNEYVEAAKSIGLSNFRIIFTQVLPNGLAPLLVTITGSLGMSILTASALSFLGFGVPVPVPEWGALVAGARIYLLTAPHLIMFPGIFISLTVLAYNLLGDGVRDALDPKLKK